MTARSRLAALALLLSVCLLLPGVAGAREFDPIDERATRAPLPASDRQAVEAWIRELADAWNSSGLRDYLAPRFPDRQRLLAAIEENVPPDARLDVLAVGPVQVLESRREGPALAHVLRVGVRFRVRATGLDGDVVQRDGRQDLTVRWIQRLPR